MAGVARKAMPFVVLLLLLSVPLWILGAMFGALPLPIDLPVGALMAFAPVVVALILVQRESGVDGVERLLSRAVDVRRVRKPVWLVIAVVLMPVVLLAAYAVLRVRGVALPEFEISPATLALFAVMFLLSGLGEELGWQGYLYPALRERWDAVTVAIVIGAVWGVWHVVPMAQMGRSPDWIFWQCAGMIPLRLIIVWLFVNAGESVFVAVLFHAMSNVAQFSFPLYGSHYDPFTTFAVLAIVAAAILTFWDLRTLERRA